MHQQPARPCRRCQERPRAYSGSYCVECQYERHRAWIEAHPGKVSEYGRTSRARHTERIRERKREHYQANPEKAKANVRRWQSTNRERVRMVHQAKSVVRRAIQRGLLTRSSQCETCGISGVTIEAAHADYTRPMDVRWLCRPCHRRWDVQNPKTRGEQHG